jgi:hypothetical protein
LGGIVTTLEENRYSSNAYITIKGQFESTYLRAYLPADTLSRLFGRAYGNN